MIVMRGVFCCDNKEVGHTGAPNTSLYFYLFWTVISKGCVTGSVHSQIHLTNQPMSHTSLLRGKMNRTGLTQFRDVSCAFECTVSICKAMRVKA